MGKFIFIANTKSFELEVTGSDEKETIANTYAILYPFVTAIDRENGAAQVDPFQRNTDELRNKVRYIVDKLSALNGRIYRLSDYFEKHLQPDE